jgi:hypothetical protein
LANLTALRRSGRDIGDAVLAHIRPLRSTAAQPG